MQAQPQSAPASETDQPNTRTTGLAQTAEATDITSVAPTARRPAISREEAIKLAMARTG